MAKPTYQPVLRALPDGAYEQSFDAAHATVETIDGSVTLAVAEREYGPIHGLFISSPEVEPFSPEDVYVEFNDQGNGCSGRLVSLSLTPEHLRIEYSDEIEAWTGRLSYEPEADPLVDPAVEYEFPLRRVVANLKIAAKDHAAVASELQRLRRNGMRVDLPSD